MTLVLINPTDEERKAAQAWGIAHNAVPQRFVLGVERSSERDA